MLTCGGVASMLEWEEVEAATLDAEAAIITAAAEPLIKGVPLEIMDGVHCFNGDTGAPALA